MSAVRWGGWPHSPNGRRFIASIHRARSIRQITPTCQWPTAAWAITDELKTRRWTVPIAPAPHHRLPLRLPKLGRSAATLFLALAALVGCNSRATSPIAKTRPSSGTELRPVVLTPQTIPADLIGGQLSEIGPRIASAAADESDQPLPAAVIRRASTGGDNGAARAPSGSAPTVVSPSNEDATAEIAGPVFTLQEEDLVRQREAAAKAARDADRNDRPIEPNELKNHHADDESAPPPEPLSTTEQTDANELLPWGPSTPSPELTAISQRAELAVRRGFNLAERGALFSARSQFIDALRTLAEALDAERNTTAHTHALGAGLRALEEVNDFVPRGDRVDVTLNMRLIIDAHHTPVLKNRPVEKITANEAQRKYLTYAQEQLAPQAAISRWLRWPCTAWEKSAPRQRNARTDRTDCRGESGRAVSVGADCRAQKFHGRQRTGRSLGTFRPVERIESGARARRGDGRMPASWRNLAAIEDRLGDAAGADHARSESIASVARLQQAGFAQAGAKYPIQWIDPTAFATNQLDDSRRRCKQHHANGIGHEGHAHTSANSAGSSARPPAPPPSPPQNRLFALVQISSRTTSTGLISRRYF